MSFFDNLVSSGKNLGASISDAVGNATNKTGTDAKRSAEITALEMEIGTIEEELTKSYIIIGRKYVEYLIVSEETPKVDVVDTLKLMAPKMTRKKELQDQLTELEKQDKEQTLIAEKLKCEQEYQEQKAKLDKALDMNIINEEEYNAKIAIYKIKVENFDEIRRIQAQYDMGIIDKNERDAKIRKFGM